MYSLQRKAAPWSRSPSLLALLDAVRFDMAEGVRLSDAEAGAALDLLENEAADLAAEAEAEGDAIKDEEEDDDVISSEEAAVRLLQRCWRGYVARKAAWALQEDAYVQVSEKRE